jgi:transposase InsO family protein
MPPDLRNHRVPTGIDTPTAAAASSLNSPAAIHAQNAARSSRRATGGLPGDRSAFRVDRAERRVPVVIAASIARVLRRPVESAQYLSIRYTERLGEAGIAPSVGSVGDSYDNALAETVIGPFTTEIIRRLGPWRSLEAVELATLEWVDWFNHRRLHEPIGNIPPTEAEERYYAELETRAVAA